MGVKYCKGSATNSYTMNKAIMGFRKQYKEVPRKRGEREEEERTIQRGPKKEGGERGRGKDNTKRSLERRGKDRKRK